ncbi:MAG: ABC transporter permease [Propionicimonas sp.]|nr:ABC transporter permease [Propionicimonas sp.]
MTALDLAPAGTAAPRRLRVWRHALMEAKLIVRNGEQLLLALVIPLGLLIARAAAGDRLGIPREAFAASVIALGLWSTGFTTLAVATGFERRYGVLERLVATPLRRVDLLLGKAVSVTLLALGQAAVLAVTALVTGWAPRPSVGQTLVVVVAVPLALLSFAALALALAGSLSAELTLALSNLVYLAGAALGVLVPSAQFPAWLRPVVDLLPTTALANALRTWADGGLDPLPLAVLAVWAVVGLALARKVFRWTS